MSRSGRTRSSPSRVRGTAGTVSLRDLREMATFRGFRRVIRENLKSGALEMANSLLKSRYLALCRRYCPELELSDPRPIPPVCAPKRCLRMARWSTIF